MAMAACRELTCPAVMPDVVLKASIDELAEAIRAVYVGQVTLAPEVIRALAEGGP